MRTDLAEDLEVRYIYIVQFTANENFNLLNHIITQVGITYQIYDQYIYISILYTK